MSEVCVLMEQVVRKAKVCEVFDEKIYHNAHLLLQIYSDVIWQTKETIDELEMECLHAYDQSVFSALDILSGFTPDWNVGRLNSQMNTAETTKAIVDIVNEALVKVKLYPRKGELYFDIINKCYLVKYKYSESELLDSLNMTRTSFYRHKKKAVNLFGITLWGFVLPNLKDRFESGTQLEPD